MIPRLQYSESFLPPSFRSEATLHPPPSPRSRHVSKARRVVTCCAGSPPWGGSPEPARQPPATPGAGSEYHSPRILRSRREIQLGIRRHFNRGPAHRPRPRQTNVNWATVHNYGKTMGREGAQLILRQEFTIPILRSGRTLKPYFLSRSFLARKSLFWQTNIFSCAEIHFECPVSSNCLNTCDSETPVL